MSERISEPERYDSAGGWQPPDPYKKLREKARSELERGPHPSSTMLSIRPASEWIARASQLPEVDLLLSLWRRGEIAVMFCGQTS